MSVLLLLFRPVDRWILLLPCFVNHSDLMLVGPGGGLFKRSRRSIKFKSKRAEVGRLKFELSFPLFPLKQLDAWKVN